MFWKFWILIILEEERFLILKEHLLLKNNPHDFFFFLNMHILKTSNSWRSCPLNIGWMDGVLGFRPWGNWESLRVHAPSLGLFIEGNLRAHALSWTERFFFFDFLIFLIFFFFLLEVKNVNNKFKQTFLWWVYNQNLSNMFLRI